jgi:hypothetical protein
VYVKYDEWSPAAVAKSRNELKIAPSIGISDENLTVV